MPVRVYGGVYEWIEGARRGRRTRCSGVRGWSASPALASAPGVTVGSVSSLAPNARAGTVRGEVVNRTARAVDATVTRARAALRRAREVRRQDRRSSARQRHGGVLGRGQAPRGPEPRQLLPGGVHAVAARTPATWAARRRSATSASRAARPSAAPPSGCPRWRTGARGRAAETCTLGRAHARQAGRARVPGHRQRRLREPPQRRLHQLRRAHEPVPAGHARRPAAALDAVPDATSASTSTARTASPARRCRARTSPSARSRSTASRRRSSSRSRPTRAIPTARTIPIRWRTAPAW